MQSCIPILRMFDETRARDFYLGYLGFNIRFEHRFSETAPLYLGLYCGECEIHLSEHHGDGSPGARLRIGVADIKAFHRTLDPNYPYARPGIMDQPWGAREVMITDPFANTLIFCQDVAPR